MAKKQLLEQLTEMESLPIDEWPTGAPNLIAEGLRHADSQVRSVATTLAWFVLDESLAQQLLNMLKADPADEVRARAAICFGPVLEDWDMFGDDSTITDVSSDTVTRIREALQQIYEDNTAPKLVRRRALEASVRAPESWHETATLKAFQSDDEDWRVTAVFCMGFVPGFGETVLDVLRSSSGDMLLEAVKSAGALGLEEAFPTIRNIALDPSADREIRVEAMYAIAAIGDDEGEEILMDLCDSDDEELAAAAEDALADLEENRGYDESDYDIDEDGTPEGSKNKN